MLLFTYFPFPGELRWNKGTTIDTLVLNNAKALQSLNLQMSISMNTICYIEKLLANPSFFQMTVYLLVDLFSVIYIKRSENIIWLRNDCDFLCLNIVIFKSTLFDKIPNNIESELSINTNRAISKHFSFLVAKVCLT